MRKDEIDRGSPPTTPARGGRAGADDPTVADPNVESPEEYVPDAEDEEEERAYKEAHVQHKLELGEEPDVLPDEGRED